MIFKELLVLCCYYNDYMDSCWVCFCRRGLDSCVNRVIDCNAVGLCVLDIGVGEWEENFLRVLFRFFWEIYKIYEDFCGIVCEFLNFVPNSCCFSRFGWNLGVFFYFFGCFCYFYTG